MSASRNRAVQGIPGIEARRISEEIIRLTDTGTFAELKTVHDELIRSLIDSDDRMQPLTDIIDAVDTLRTNGPTLEAFQEILRERRCEEELPKRRWRSATSFRPSKRECMAPSDIAALKEQRGFFGLGGVQQEARESMAQNESRS